MFDNEANAMVAILAAGVPGRASATTGPGPNAAVRYYVEGTPIVFSAVLTGDKIASQALTEPPGGILWGIREDELSISGAERSATYFVEWLARQRRLSPSSIAHPKS